MNATKIQHSFYKAKNIHIYFFVNKKYSLFNVQVVACFWQFFLALPAIDAHPI